MRIISGKFRGKKLAQPTDNLTRPLKDIVKDSELYYDPKNNNTYDTIIEEDKGFLEMYK